MGPLLHKSLQSMAERVSTPDCVEAKKVLVKYGVPDRSISVFLEYLSEFAGYHFKTLHDEVWLTPTVAPFPQAKSIRTFGLEDMLTSHGGRWWLEAVDSRQAVEPMYLGEDGRLYYEKSTNAITSSSVASYLEGAFFVNQVSTWERPWYKLIHALRSVPMEIVANRLSIYVHTYASDEFRCFLKDDRILVSLFPMHDLESQVNMLWVFGRDKAHLTEIDKIFSDLWTKGSPWDTEIDKPMFVDDKGKISSIL